MTWMGSRPLLLLLAICSGGAPVAETHAEGFAPEEAVRRMQVADGFEVQLVASEPLVRQPVAIEFDDRGRLWVIQYLQYPNPEGLKRVQVDRYSRTTYDRVPEPPPHGPRGADRITILEDADGDGRLDRGRDFVNGLNLTTGIAFGHGGVFVLNVPYLLFYPDRNRDDVPDSDPQVLLSGFGMEDAHSVANSLTWGPDGWLYGCQGSTVTAKVRGIGFQQGVWRYHPLTQQFELFCEGGGNSWGLDFDPEGNLLYSTNFGAYVLLHGVQGGYFVKAFGKHGALHNPHAYGYFDHVPHQNFRGGHVTVGGIVYQGDSFPESFRGKYIAGDLLGHGVYWHDIQRRGSTFQTAHGGELLVANDTWFAPTDLTLGPDGAIYVSDWHDARTAHPDPDADWDRSNGRIYRISAARTPAANTLDLAEAPTDELLRLHAHPSQWYVRRARQELARRHALGERRDEPAVIEQLRDAVTAATSDRAALEALWTLYTIGGLDEVLATKLLSSPCPAVRSWTVRWLGDQASISSEMAHRLDELAEHEPRVEVRQQLACTAQRLPAQQAMPVISANINRDVDNDDPYLPLLWWWAVERHSVSGRDEVLRRFVRPTLWMSRLGRDTLLPRLIRRYAAEGTSAGWDSVARLLAAAPDEAARGSLWSPLLLGWQSQTEFQLPPSPELEQRILVAWNTMPDDLNLLNLAMALGNREPRAAAREAAFNPKTDPDRRIALFAMLRSTSDAALVNPLLEVVAVDESEPIRIAALQTLAHFESPQIAERLLALHGSSESPTVRSQVRDILLSRKESARVWLAAVDRGEVPAAATSLDQVRRVALLADPALNSLLEKHWGKLESGTREEVLAEVRRLNNDLRAMAGNAATGQLVFKKHCATCHQLFGDGTKLGPDLTSANRQDRDFLLISLVDPSTVIRKEYVSVVIQTNDGRVLTGLPVVRDDSGVTLVDAKNMQIAVAAAEIDELHESPVSLMPSDLYRQLQPQELRDLFAYLQRSP